MTEISKQRGDVQVVVFATLTLVVLALIGVLFWQNFIVKPESDNSRAAVTENTESIESAKSTTDSTALTPTPSVNLVAEAKSGISESMNRSDFSGLEKYLAPTVEMAISHTDSGVLRLSGKEAVATFHKYFRDYANSNKQPVVTEWTLADFKDITNKKLKDQAAASKFFDFSGTYVGIGKGSTDDAFAAFRLNDEGKITYIFYGFIYGY